MREEPIRSLLLVDSDPAGRRLVSAIASRAGWTVVGAADSETAVGLLQGPHGREVKAALLRIYRDWMQSVEGRRESVAELEVSPLFALDENTFRERFGQDAAHPERWFLT